MDTFDVSATLVGPVICGASTTNEWLALFDVSALAEGQVIATTIYEDHVGNSSLEQRVTRIKDTMAPMVEINIGGHIRQANVGGYTVSGKCSELEKEVTVELRDRGSVVNNAFPSSQPTCALDKTWTVDVDVEGFRDGYVDVYATHADEAGNHPTHRIEVIKDVIDLELTIDLVDGVMAPPNILAETAGSYVISGTCTEPGQKITVELSDSTQTIPANPHPICGVPEEGRWSTQVDGAALADETITITATLSDLLGGTTTLTPTVTKDTDKPDIDIDTFSHIVADTPRSPYSLGGSCEQGQENREVIVVLMDGESHEARPSDTVSCLSGAWSAEVDLSPLTKDGDVSIAVSYTDPAGNVGDDTETVQQDTVAPIVTILSPNNIFPATKLSYSISGTCSEIGEDVTVVFHEDITDPSTTLTTTAPCTLNGSKGEWTLSGYDVNTLPDATSTTPNIKIKVSQTDSLGNSTTTEYTVLKSTSDVRVGILTSPVINIANKSSYEVTGDCAPNNGTLTVRIGTVQPTSTPTCPFGIWSATFDLSDSAVTPDGTAITITVDYTESGKNAPRITGQTLKDTGAPTISFDPDSGNILDVTRNLYPISGGCSEPGRPVTLTLTDDLVPPTRILATPICNSGNRWEFNVVPTSLNPGTNNITLTATLTDAAGNPPAQEASLTKSKDVIPPVLEITSAENILVDTEKSQYPISGTCDESNATVSLELSDSNLPTPNKQSATGTCNGSVWAAQANVSSFIDGDVTIVASYEDSSGNPGEHQKTVQQDTGEPGIVIITPPNILHATRSNYGLQGTCSDNGEQVTATLTHKVNISEQASASVNCGHATSGNWEIRFDTVSAGLSDGTVQITAIHRDRAGNTKTIGADTPIEVVRDTVLPDVRITTANDISAELSQTAIPVSGSCTEYGQQVTVVFTDDQNAQKSPDSQPTCTASGEAGTWSTTVDTTTLDLGPIIITAGHLDTAGNPAPGGSATIRKVETASAEVTDADNILVDTNQNAYEVQGSCSENGKSVVVTIVDREEVSISHTVRCGETTGGRWSVSFVTTSLAQGDVTIDIVHEGIVHEKVVVKDIVGPTFGAVVSSGHYGKDQSINTNIKFPPDVVVTGRPQLRLEVGDRRGALHFF